MYALNKAQLIGYLTEDPNIRQTPAGQSVGDLNIVTKNYYTDSSGEQKTSQSFHNVVIWRGLADIAGRFLKKGSQVYIAGRAQTDEWEDQKTGQKRYKTRITADDMIILDPKNPNAPLSPESKVAGGLNQAEIIGNLTRDPETRQTPNGATVSSFSVATNYTWKDRSGETQEKTEFHNVVAWGDLAKSIGETVKKGRKVYVSGRLQTRSWDTPEGNKRYTTEIISENVLALGVPDADLGTPASNSVASEAPVPTPAAPQNTSEVPPINYESEIKPEDLPF